MPAAVKRTVGILPNLLWDKTAYALGRTAGTGRRTAEEHAAFRATHLELLANVDDDGLPLFPFGFGLSYTTFRYDHLAVQSPAAGNHADIRATVEVTNTGNREGDDVVELYEHAKK